MYVVGVDLGTTFTAAATWRAEVAEIATLGDRAAVIPSVVLPREDGTVLVGDPADRRGLAQPDRVAREFKRRLGDTTPILLGGEPHSAESLTARLLRAVVERIAAAEGGPPAALCLSHPANWGEYKTDLLRQAVRLADLDLRVTLSTEPEAAAVSYARSRRLDPGDTVAVYDLGGGTFDATVVRQTADGFRILGQPEGIEHLGGVDFDAAVFDHVRRSLGDRLDTLDDDDPAALAAVAQLRDECTRARETLSSDTDASVPVVLPGFTTEVRLTRAELETMIRPALAATVEALRRALRSAEVAPEDLHSVLLVGGASRTPVVAQTVGAELGRPVAVDAHPKHAVALGAAHLAARYLTRPRTAPAPTAQPAPAPPPQAPPAAPAAVTGKAAVPVRPVALTPEPATEPVPGPATATRWRRWPLLAVGAALVVTLGTGGAALARLRDQADPPPLVPSQSARGTPTSTPSPSVSPSPRASAPEESGPPVRSAPPPPPPPRSPSSAAPPPEPSTTATATPGPTAAPTVAMPYVLYLECGDAALELADLGLVVDTSGPTEDTPVIAQAPTAGTEVAVGSTVEITCGPPR